MLIHIYFHDSGSIMAIYSILISESFWLFSSERFLFAVRLVRLEEIHDLWRVLIRTGLGHYPIMSVFKVELMKLIFFFMGINERTWGVEFKVYF